MDCKPSEICNKLSGCLICRCVKSAYIYPEYGVIGRLIDGLPFAVFSLFVLSDVAGWFFGIWGIYLSLNWLSKDNARVMHAACIGLLMGLGCLAKESAVTGFIFLTVYLLFHPSHIRKKAAWLLTSFLGFLLPLGISCFLVRHFNDDSMFNRISDAWQEVNPGYFEIFSVKQLYRVIDQYWFLFLIGLASLLKPFKGLSTNREMKSILLSCAITFVALPAWPYFFDRIIFMLAPFLLIIAVPAIRKFRHFGFPLIAAGGFLNILISFLIYRYQLNGLLATGAVIYLLLMGVFALSLKKVKAT